MLLFSGEHTSLSLHLPSFLHLIRRLITSSVGTVEEDNLTMLPHPERFRNWYTKVLVFLRIYKEIYCLVMQNELPDGIQVTKHTLYSSCSISAEITSY
jgi:hypothetical protein